MNSAYIYLQLYRLFDKVTPLAADCGRLCNKACCEGEDSGMYLFPGEKRVFDLIGSECFEISDSDFTYTYKGKMKSVPVLMCKGECDRYQRPLACRIFPLTPYLNKGKLKIIIDPRAKSLCPLAINNDISVLEPEFIVNVEKVFRILLTNKEFYSFMEAYSVYISEYLKFFK